MLWEAWRHPRTTDLAEAVGDDRGLEPQPLARCRPRVHERGAARRARPLVEVAGDHVCRREQLRQLSARAVAVGAVGGAVGGVVGLVVARAALGVGAAARRGALAAARGGGARAVRGVNDAHDAARAAKPREIGGDSLAVYPTVFPVCDVTRNIELHELRGDLEWSTRRLSLCATSHEIDRASRARQ